jgi:hypothetical protein
MLTTNAMRTTNAMLPIDALLTTDARRLSVPQRLAGAIACAVSESAAWLGYGPGLLVCSVTILLLPLLWLGRLPHVNVGRFGLLIVGLALGQPLVGFEKPHGDFTPSTGGGTARPSPGAHPGTATKPAVAAGTGSTAGFGAGRDSLQGPKRHRGLLEPRRRADVRLELTGGDRVSGLEAKLRPTADGKANSPTPAAMVRD